MPSAAGSGVNFVLREPGRLSGPGAPGRTPHAGLGSGANADGHWGCNLDTRPLPIIVPAVARKLLICASSPTQAEASYPHLMADILRQAHEARNRA